MRHEWTENFSVGGDVIKTTTWAVEDGRVFADGEPESFSECDSWPNEILRLAARVRKLEGERDRAWERVIRERDRKNAVAVAYSGTEIQLRGRIAALEAENAALRDALEDAAPIVGAVEDGADDPPVSLKIARALNGETRWASVYGGGET